jgi:DNA modification methylase/transcriptional regulator with XRE-family HTH domain
MTDSLFEDSPVAIPFADRLREFRAKRGLSYETLADLLGIPAQTVRRWEAGSARPSISLSKQLTNHGFGEVSAEETNSASRSRIKVAAFDNHRVQHHREFAIEFLEIPGATAPAWARNGPPDQDDFYRALIKLQLVGLPKQHYERLSLVECYAPGLHTAQSLLEAPKETVASWNSNYGSHGWHRYVGRFPPHVVRALLNHFNAGPKSLVCDPFSGSGTTAVECRLLGIPFVGIEICALSYLISKVKAGFDPNPSILTDLAQRYKTFMERELEGFMVSFPTDFTVPDIIGWSKNPIPHFANCEKWFTPEALLGVSLTMQFANLLAGFEKDALLVALSAKMRSIGNVDVDVVRAEYSRLPRRNVAVDRLVERQLKKMAGDIARITKTHHSLLGEPSSIRLIEDSALDVELEPASVDCIITSPPYGVEAISYLRTHLLSYRSLAKELKHDPYDTREQTIGSEYLEESELPVELEVARSSASFRDFFDKNTACKDKNGVKRRIGMMKFFEDMYVMGRRMAGWLKDGGQMAFIVGNKRLDDSVIPTDIIIQEAFRSSGLVMYDAIRHKLKTNNSNSQVPWQERIIQEETILLFRRESRL